MASLNSEEAALAGPGWQQWIIEDSWEGHKLVEARLLGSWQGLCGWYRLLEGVDGRCYFWLVLKTGATPGAWQRLVSFPDEATMRAALDLADWGTRDGARTAAWWQ